MEPTNYYERAKRLLYSTTGINLPEKSLIVMDNATFHKGEEMRKLLQDSGHTLLYLPPYSPDLNPFEKK